MKFIGYPSGDNEEFCFDVTREEFIKVKGREPALHERSLFHVNMYRLYMHDAIPALFERKDLTIGGKEFKMKVELEVSITEECGKRVVTVKSQNLTPDPKDFINFDEVVEEVPLDFL